jgi:cytochrome b
MSVPCIRRISDFLSEPLEAFMAVHLAGVFLAEFTNQKEIIS